MKKFNTYLLINLLLIIGLIVLLICIFILPQLAREAALQNPEVAFLKIPILFGMYASAIPFFYAIYEAICIIKIAEHESIFSTIILQSLNHIRYCAFIILTLYLTGFFILHYYHALPPIISLLGLIILICTISIVSISTFIRRMLLHHAPIS